MVESSEEKYDDEVADTQIDSPDRPTLRRMTPLDEEVLKSIAMVDAAEALAVKRKCQARPVLPPGLPHDFLKGPQKVTLNIESQNRLMIFLGYVYGCIQPTSKSSKNKVTIWFCQTFEIHLGEDGGCFPGLQVFGGQLGCSFI